MSGKKKEKGKGRKFVCLNEWVLNGPAYRALSCRARCLLVELYRKYQGEESGTNGNLYLSVRDAATALNCTKDTAAQAFDELEAFGFIRVAVKSGFSWKHGIATRWVLTEFPYANSLAEKIFMRLSEEKAKEIAAGLKRKWAEQNRIRAERSRKRKRERAAKLAAERKKRGPNHKDTVSLSQGQCPADKDSFGAQCPNHKDGFGQNGSESVLTTKTDLIYQDRAAVQALAAAPARAGRSGRNPLPAPASSPEITPIPSSPKNLARARAKKPRRTDLRGQQRTGD
jgi:hypothetical protein